MGKDLTLSCSGGDFVEAFEITVKPRGITVLVGYNATLRSMIARGFLYCNERDRERYGPTLKDLGIEYSLSDPELPCRVLRGYVPDNRIVLRSLYQAGPHIEELWAGLEWLRWKGREAQVADVAIELEENFRQLLNAIGLSILNDLKEFKERAGSKAIGFLQKIFDEELEKLPKYLEKTFENGIGGEGVVPLEILNIDYREKTIPYVKIRDTRFNRDIKADLASTSIIAPLLHEYIINFLAVSESEKILVIEEPEEAMTPLQQVFTVKFLEKAVIKSDELLNSRTYVVLTTHSPYVALAAENVELYFASYSRETKKIRIDRGKPHRPFLMADYIIMGAEGG